MRRGEDGQRLHAKQNDGNQRHGDGDVKGILQHFDRWLLNSLRKTLGANLTVLCFSFIHHYLQSISEDYDLVMMMMMMMMRS